MALAYHSLEFSRGTLDYYLGFAMGGFLGNKLLLDLYLHVTSENHRGNRKIAHSFYEAQKVFAGTELRVFLDAAWFWVVNNVLYLYFPLIEGSVLGRMFYVKDISRIPNVLKFEYEKARAERHKVVSDSISKSE
ncbi:hypothetical protein RIF29_13388 [Crotalaria pallida]|uniref:Uncharacterized protein n=1 Tax=Crotalaria pallida TaxID=3830 RepID=A0AAN9IP65_CROPI